jgi:hypothetical protein
MLRICRPDVGDDDDRRHGFPRFGRNYRRLFPLNRSTAGHLNPVDCVFAESYLLLGGHAAVSLAHESIDYPVVAAKTLLASGDLAPTKGRRRPDVRRDGPTYSTLGKSGKRAKKREKSL